RSARTPTGYQRSPTAARTVHFPSVPSMQEAVARSRERRGREARSPRRRSRRGTRRRWWKRFRGSVALGALLLAGGAAAAAGWTAIELDRRVTTALATRAG